MVFEFVLLTLKGLLNRTLFGHIFADLCMNLYSKEGMAVRSTIFQEQNRPFLGLKFLRRV